MEPPPYIHLNKEAASEELLQHLAQSLASFPAPFPRRLIGATSAHASYISARDSNTQPLFIFLLEIHYSALAGAL